MNLQQPDTMVVVHPTDVWVCLRSGVWNLTNPDPTDQRIPSRTTRAILRGLLLAASETLDEIDAGDLLLKPAVPCSCGIGVSGAATSHFHGDWVIAHRAPPEDCRVIPPGSTDGAQS